MKFVTNTQYKQMETNLNLDSHSSLIIADGSIVEINGQKVLLTLVKDGDKPETSEAGSELFGKWVRYAQEGYGITDKWFKIEEIKGFTQNPELHFVLKGLTGYYKDECFDLSNALSYNPETLIGKYWNGAKITDIYINENDSSPYFSLESTVVNSIKCSKVTPSDVTDTPPLPSLKYEDCFERVQPKLYVNYECKVSDWDEAREDCVATERQAKQLAATIKLMTIAHDANGGWIPNAYDVLYTPFYDREEGEMGIARYPKGIPSPIYFKDKETALRAYESNKEIFHDYFGVGGGE